MTKDAQDAEAELERKFGTGMSGFLKRGLDKIELICFTKKGKNESFAWKICLTD